MDVEGCGTAANGRPATVMVPAELRFLEVIRLAVRIAGEGRGLDGESERDLQLASDELAAVLILAARSCVALHLSVDHDGDDVYVRMSVPLSDDGFHPEVPNMTKLLLDATVDSYEICTDGDDVIGVLQRSLTRG